MADTTFRGYVGDVVHWVTIIHGYETTQVPVPSCELYDQLSRLHGSPFSAEYSPVSDVTVDGDLPLVTCLACLCLTSEKS